MKRGKDEEKIMGPMFPRLHVNDKEKGGPRAPPRNKMALYEQLSIPSQRFNPGVLPLNNNNPTNLVPPASSSQGSLHERSVFFPLHLPPSMPTHPPHSDSSTSLAQLEQGKKVGDEDDFRVPIFVHSGMGQCHSKNQNSIDGDRLTSLSPGCSMKLQNASDKESKRTSIAGVSSRQELRSQNEWNPRECVPIWNHSVKSSSNLSTRENLNGPLKQANASSNRECRDLPPDNFSRLHDGDASLQLKCRAGSEPEDTAPSDGDSVEPKGGIEKGNSSRPRKDYRSEECHSSHPDNDNEYCGNKTCGSLQGGNVDRGDDVSEASMVDSISGLDISPDDVVGIIGQKHFWKARRAIVNQQRVFAVQVFELHRLIKVQRLIAGSPHLLLEDNAYLGKPPLAVSPAKKLPLEYIVKPPPHNVKHKDDSEKPNHKMECYAENAVGKTSLSVHNGTQHSNYRPYSGNAPSTPVTTDTQMGPWCFHQPPGHQWLVPVMSPSEGLIYKPYPGSEFMGPVYGGCGPPGPTPMMGNFLNPAYGVPASHHHYQGIGVAPGAPPVGHGYFPPYGMPVMNPAISGSVVEQMNHLAGAGSQSQTDLLSGGGANFNNQSSCNMPSQKSGAIPNVVKFQASKDSELQGSTASSPSGQARGVGVHHIAEGRDALPLFPTAPVVRVSDGAPRETDHQTRAIKVVPHNPRSATESAARIFRSIQEERKQYDLI